MTSKEAIKRLRQKTAPATYMPDFDKEECLKIIEKDLEELEQYRKVMIPPIIKLIDDLQILELLIKHTDIKLINNNPDAPIFSSILKSEHLDDWLQVREYLLRGKNNDR